MKQGNIGDHMSREGNQANSVQPGMNAMPQGYFVPMMQDEYPEDEISLLDYWRMLMKHKLIIIAVTLLSTMGATFYALTATPVYRAEVLMAPAQEQGEKGGGLAALANQFGGLASMAGISLGGGGNTETALAILQSREFTEQYIRERNLLPALFTDRWDQEIGVWKAKETSWLSSLLVSEGSAEGPGAKTAEADTAPTMWDAYKLVKNRILSVSTDKKTGLITLAVEWGDPVLAAEWANDAVVRVNQHIRQQAIAEAEKKIAYLQTELAKTSVVEAKALLYSVMEEQIKGIMLANVRDEYAFRIIDPAVVPQERSKPKRRQIVVLGFVLGLMLGGLLAFVIHSIQRSKESSAEVA